MAVICNDSTDYLTRLSTDTGGIPANNSYTVAGWFKRSSDRDNYERALIYHMVVVPDPYINVISFYPSWDGTYDNMTVLRADTGGTPDPWTTLPGTGSWMYLAMTCDGTDIKGYWYDSSFNLVDGVQTTAIGTPHPPSSIDIMSDSYEANKYVDGKCCYIRVWSVALTQAEIAAECSSSVIVKTANISTALGACTDANFANDVSGNGRNWTRGATLGTTQNTDWDTDVPAGLSSGSTTVIGAMRPRIITPFATARQRF